MKRLIIITLMSTIAFCHYGKCQTVQYEPYLFKSNSGKEMAAEIGSFEVKENRRSGDHRTIKLQFVRFKSTNSNPGNPIVYLAGGPGGSGINAAKGKRFELFMALRDVADVIAFDQRGTGLSNNIPQCPVQGQFELTQPGTMDYYLDEMKSTATACMAFWQENNVDITAYNTLENADDIEDLRKALGVEKINLWGISYGSHLAFNYIKRYGQNVDQVVLAGLEGPDHTIKRPSFNQKYLESLNDLMLRDSNAKAAYGDLIVLMSEVLADLNKNPVTAKARDPRSGQEFEVGISKLDAQLVTSFFLTKNPEDSKKLPLMYHKMKNGDYTDMALMVGMLKMYAGRAQAMPMAMDAMSGVSESRWSQIEQETEGALLGRTTNFPYPDLSSDLNLPDLGSEFRTNPKSSVNALFFSGTLDGRTYLESAKELVSGFSNASHVIIDGAGHDLFMSTPKITEMIKDYFSGNKIESQSLKIDIPKFVLPN